MKSVRRNLAFVAEEDRLDRDEAAPGGPGLRGGRGGRPVLYAYGLLHLAALAARTVQTVRAARKAGVQLCSPVGAVCWALERRGFGQLAKMVSAIFGDRVTEHDRALVELVELDQEIADQEARREPDKDQLRDLRARRRKAKAAWAKVDDPGDAPSAAA